MSTEIKVDHARQYEMVGPVTVNGFVAAIQTHAAHGTERHFAYTPGAFQFVVLVSDGVDTETVTAYADHNSSAVHSNWQGWLRRDMEPAVEQVVKNYCALNKLR